MVSMKDIAAECGVSVATVSKALNNYSDIGAETRKKVGDAARRLGYYPNSSARALKTKRTWHIGVLFTDEANSGLTHHFFSRILESIKNTAEAEGYDITFVSDTISKRRTSYLEHCRYRGVDGVVVANIDFYGPSIQELILSDLPIVTIDHVFDNRIAIVSDNISGMRDLVNYACELGHTRIAYIHGADSSVTRARLSSFYNTLSQQGITVPDEYDLEAAYLNVEAAIRQTQKLLALPQPPTCIMYPDDISCIGAMNYLRARGICPGKDISVAGYDGYFLSKIQDPVLTTIVQDTETIGSLATRKLISLIENPKATIIERITVKGMLQKGASIAKL